MDNFWENAVPPKINDNAWHHIYHKINSQSLYKTVMDNSVLISIDLSGNMQSVKMSSFCEKSVINATQEGMALFILVFRYCGLGNWLLELTEIL